MAIVYVVWFILGLLLLVAEMHTAAFYAMFLGLGAFAAGVLAFVLPDSPLWAQAVLALAVSLIGVVLVRPWFTKRFIHQGRGALSPGTHGGFVGEHALATDAIGDELHPGHVRLAGENWLAFCEDGSEIQGNTSVVITAVRGTTMVVRASTAVA